MTISEIISSQSLLMIKNKEAKTLKDINNGLCEVLSDRVSALFDVEIFSIYSIDECDELGVEDEALRAAAIEGFAGHTFIYSNGKYFDSEAQEGVLEIHQLPSFMRAIELERKREIDMEKK